MMINPKAKKTPKPFLPTGEAARALRRKLKLNQSEFWGRINVSQTGGSIYESGRNFPPQVLLLLHLAYAPTTQAIAMLNHLRIDKIVSNSHLRKL